MGEVYWPWEVNELVVHKEMIIVSSPAQGNRRPKYDMSTFSLTCINPIFPRWDEGDMCVCVCIHSDVSA